MPLPPDMPISLTGMLPFFFYLDDPGARRSMVFVFALCMNIPTAVLIL